MLAYVVYGAPAWRGLTDVQEVVQPRRGCVGQFRDDEFPPACYSVTRCDGGVALAHTGIATEAARLKWWGSAGGELCCRRWRPKREEMEMG